MSLVVGVDRLSKLVMVKIGQIKTTRFLCSITGGKYALDLLQKYDQDMARSGPLCIIKGHLHCGPLNESNFSGRKAATRSVYRSW